MKKTFFENFDYTEKVKNSIWGSCLFVLDTNVLLNMYRYSDQAQSEFFTRLDELKDRLWIPYQIGFEFFNNRRNLISSQLKEYDDLTKQLAEITKKLNSSFHHPFLSDGNLKKWIEFIDIIHGDLSKSREKIEESITDDKTLTKISRLYDEKVGPNNTQAELDKMVKEAQERNKNKIPPGYMDSSKNNERYRAPYGDYILWRQIMEKSKSDKINIIFVTNDQKEDWWLIQNGKKISIRPELRREFHAETKQKVLIYTPERFLNRSNTKSNTHISEETIKEISEIPNSDNSKNVFEISLKDIYSRLIRNEYEGDNVEDLIIHKEGKLLSMISREHDLSERLKNLVNKNILIDSEHTRRNIRITKMRLNDLQARIEKTMSEILESGDIELYESLLSFRKNLLD